MAVTVIPCNSFRHQLLAGEHHLVAGGGDTFRCALFLAQSLGAATTAYGATGEVGESGDYSTGGEALTTQVSTSGATGYFGFADLAIAGSATISADQALIYNDTHAGNAAVCVIDFGATVTSTAGTFTVNFPTTDASTGMIKISGP